jgi:hypothetical protein
MREATDDVRLAYLRKELAEVNKAPLVPDLDRSGWVYKAYQRNAADLLRYIQIPHPNFHIALQTRVPSDNPEIYNHYHAELLRLLLNYVASVMALVEHTRHMERKLQVANPETHRSYRRRLDKVIEEGVTHFVQDLRDFVLHVDLPTTSGRTSFTQGEGVKFDILLDAVGLLRWRRWSPKAKEYLKQTDTISLANAVIEYDRLVAAFYHWMFGELPTVLFDNARRKLDLEMAVQALESRLANREMN